MNDFPMPAYLNERLAEIRVRSTKAKVKVGLVGTLRNVFEIELGKGQFAALKSALRANPRIDLHTAEDIVPDGILFAGQLDQLDQIVKRLLAGGIEVLILVPVNYGAEWEMALIAQRLHRAFGIPVYTYVYPDPPVRANGTRALDAGCGINPAREMIRTMIGMDPGYIPSAKPDDPLFLNGVENVIAVAGGLAGTKRIRAGQIGADQPTFYAVQWDPFWFQTRYGMYVETIDAGDFRDQIMAGISLPPSWLDEGVRYFSQWRDYSGVIAEFPDMAKLDALTFGVVVDILAKKQLTSVTINCWTELMEKLRLMVCGVNGLLFQHGIVAPCETDKPGLWAAELMRGMAIGHYDAHPMFFADFPTNIFYDTEKVLGWHCGPARPDKCAGCRAKCGKGWVIPTTRGAAGASLGRWGEVGETMTFVQYRRSGSGQWTLIAYNGTTCEGEETLGTHFYVGMPGRMREFEAFMSTNPFDHHNVAILGDFVDPLTEVARWLQAPCATAKFAK